MSVRLSLRVRDLVVASWPAEREAVARAVYPGLEPAVIDGEHLVSIVGIRFAGGRLGALPVPPFSQLNARTYVKGEAGTAVFFLRSYVTPAGLGGAAFGIPLRAARVRVGSDRLEARGAGVALRFRTTAAGGPGELATHEDGFFEAAGLRHFRIRRGDSEWTAAEVEGEPRADVLLAHGFEVEGRPRVFYARGASFETDVPPSAVPLPRSSSSRSHR